MRKNRKPLKSYYARKRDRGFYTKPERKILECLKSIDIEFFYQYKIPVIDEEGRKYVFTVDYFIQPDIVIEVDDDKVHGTRRSMRKMRWRDNLLMKYGFKIYHFWKSDIETDPTYICSRIKEILWFHRGM